MTKDTKSNIPVFVDFTVAVKSNVSVVVIVVVYLNVRRDSVSVVW